MAVGTLPHISALMAMPRIAGDGQPLHTSNPSHWTNISPTVHKVRSSALDDHGRKWPTSCRHRVANAAINILNAGLGFIIADHNLFFL